MGQQPYLLLLVKGLLLPFSAALTTNRQHLRGHGPLLSSDRVGIDVKVWWLLCEYWLCSYASIITCALQ